MKTILLTITITFILGFFNLLNAQDRWVLYGIGEKALHYYDKNSIVRDGNIVKVWRKWIYSNHDEIDYVILRTFFKCGERLYFFAVNYIYYYKDGSSEDKSSMNDLYFDDYNLIYNDIYPDTGEEVLYNILCDY